MSNRRQFLKTAAAGFAAGGGYLGGRQARAAEQTGAAKGATIKVAGYDYDRVRAIMDGRVGIKGSEVHFDTQKMYGRAKKYAYADLETTTALKVSLPWVAQEFEDTRALMGRDFWPYGIEIIAKSLSWSCVTLTTRGC